MAYPDIETVLSWRGRTIVDETGAKIGKFEEIYLDTQTERPEWAAVKTGLFSRGQVLVPLSEAQEHDDDTLRVPFAKDHVENAPDVDADGELSQEDEARLYAHYGLEYSQEQSDTGLRGGDAHEQRTAAEDRAEQRESGERAAAQPESVPSESGGRDAALSEEEVESFDVEQQPRERVRLKKYVVTEEMTKKVPVQREEIRVEREPLEGEGRQD